MPARKGELHHMAKLNDDLVRELRRAYRTEGISCFKLCERIGWLVHESVLRDAVTGKSWKHVR